MPISATTRGAPYLLFRCGAVCAALPLVDVRETLRPLPIVAIESAPSFVRGMAVVRGLSTVIVDGCELLARSGDPVSEKPSVGRFISLRVPDGSVALAVESVLGIRDFAEAAVTALPPLLGSMEHSPIEQLANLDGKLWMLLRAGRLCPEIADVQTNAMEMIA